MAFFEFPHTRTYDSDLGWLIHAYQLLKAQADDIQGSIQQIVDDTLNDPTYVARVLAVLAPLNVKYPPSDAGLNAAKGDGVTDDTDAITGMIAYAYEHNMPLLFPAGQYLVSGLTVSNDVSFIGLGGTLFLKAGAVNPLITVKGGYLTATGLEFNGNIAGQTNPKNVFVVDGGGFKLDNCIITGGVDGIHADIDSSSLLSAVEINNFTEYGIYVEGSSFINANGITMDVASGGALRLMRVDASNCVFNGVESLAEVAIAFEVTGDFNYFLARVPNADTPASDNGQNNNFEIVAQLSKRTYQNLMEKVEGDYTQEVGDFDGTATGHYKFTAPDIIFEPSNPITYGTPVNGLVPYKTPSGVNYNVLTEEAQNATSIKYYGAKGDGKTDDTAAFTNAFESGKLVFFIPNGTYMISSVTLPDGCTLIGESKSAIIKQRSDYTFNLIVGGNNNVLYNLTLDNNGSGKSGTFAGIRFMRKSYSSIINCLFVNGIQWNAYSNGSSHLLFENCEFSNCKNGASITLAGDNEGYCTIRKCYSHNNALDGFVIGQPYTTIEDCVSISNGSSETGACGIFCNDNASYSMIFNNRCMNNYGIGIEVAGASNFLRIVNNHVINNGYDGIEARQCNHIFILNNYLFGNTSKKFGGQISYSVTAGDMFSVIDGNIIDCNNITQYGIYAPSANKCIGNNIITNYTESALNVSQSGQIGAVEEDQYFLFKRWYIRYTDSRMMNIINAGSGSQIQIAGNMPFQFASTEGGLQRVAGQFNLPSNAPSSPSNGDLYADADGIHVRFGNAWHTIAYTS